jgi:RNA polymerase sigma-70 factor (ECF subfamily)
MHAMGTPTLLERIAEGDKSAVADFIDRYGGLVWSLARRFTSTESDAEDAVQDIFLDLWKSCKSYRPELASETTFTAMIARRRLIDRQRRRRLPLEASDALDSLASRAISAVAAVEDSEEAERAAELLQSLPAEQCQAIKLAVYDGLSHTQIADVTGLSLGTVKSHIRRGFIKLREQIGLAPSRDSAGGVA